MDIDILCKQIYIDNEPTNYWIYNNGQVWSNTSKIFLKPFTNPCGYLLVDLHHNKKSKYFQIHRLVAMYFIPNPDNLPIVNHIDGDKTNCDYKNLEWCTAKDNTHHAWKTGLIQPRYGIKNPANKYDPKQIHKVCQLIEEGTHTLREISKLTNVSTTVVYDIMCRGKWTQISCVYNIHGKESKWYVLRNRIKEMVLQNYERDNVMKTLSKEYPDKKYKKFIFGWFNHYKHSLNDYPCKGSTPTS